MTVVLPPRPRPGPRQAPPTRSYRDAGSGCRVVATTPAAEPELWARYLAGAEATYRRHGVASVVDRAALADGRRTSLVFVALDDAGEVVGGVRAQGPYASAGEAHALVEFAASPDRAEVRRIIASRVPDGVIEIKTAWVSPTAPCRHALAAAIPRTALHAAALLGARHAFFTSAVHTVRTWCTTGAVIVPTVEPVAYPDERYRTALGWLDSDALTGLAEPEQLRAVAAEQAQLLAAVRVAA